MGDGCTQAQALPQLRDPPPQPLPTPTLPNVPPHNPWELRLGEAWCERRGLWPSQSIQSHMPHAGRGTASWEVLLGFLLQASPQARTGVSRETERPPHPT